MIDKTSNNKISFDELRQMVENPDVQDSELERFFIIDESSRNSFNPKVLINPETVDIGPEIADRSIDFLHIVNTFARICRHKQYLARIRHPFFIAQKIVSEGDSWFQFPFLLKDVIDQLFVPFYFKRDYAIYSLGAGGDLLQDIIDQDEIARAVEKTGTEIALISGGGNDLLGDMNAILNDFHPDLKPKDYLNKTFDECLEKIIECYRRLLKGLISQFDHLKILCHGYDYVIPVRGGLLGKPMESKGIKDSSLQKAIMKEIIDRVNREQIALIENLDRVFHVDCRGAVDEDQWHDEIHPTNAGYKSVAERFDQKIREVSNHEVPDIEVNQDIYYRLCESTKGEYVKYDGSWLRRWKREEIEEQLFFFKPLGDDWYHISCKAHPNLVWTLQRGHGDNIYWVKLAEPDNARPEYSKFKLTAKGSGYQIDEATKGEVIEIHGSLLGEGYLARWAPTNPARQRYRLEEAGPRE